MTKRPYDTPGVRPVAATLWSGAHKIPWNDPGFSARILREHLSQDHHLASRKSEIIREQTTWIHNRFLPGGDKDILDLGCGPGLYAPGLVSGGNRYLGIDFGPASIEYARSGPGLDERCDFLLGDVTEIAFGGPYDLAMMLYGEINVFSSSLCRRILSKAYESLRPGGVLLLEAQHPDAVRAVGLGASTSTRADSGGLFSDAPYRCLTDNHWYESEQVALQCFHVATESETVSYRSTTRAWTCEALAGVLRETGFDGVASHDDWPAPGDGMMLVSARKLVSGR